MTGHDHEETKDELGHLHHVLDRQAVFLRDPVRNKAFFDALRKSVTPGCAVLDIGSGTGIWAIVAARLGAGRVVAIEREEFLIPIITNLARANGVADRVQVAQGASTDIELDQRFDVIVSETIGNQAFEEQIIPTMLDAKERFLAPDGALIPERVVMMAAPAHIKRRRAKIPTSVPLNYGYFDAMRANMPSTLDDRSKLTLLGDSRELLHVDLKKLESAPSFAKLAAARWELDDATKLDCFAVWGEATLVDGVTISTMEARSWSVVLYSVETFQARKGEVEFQLGLSEGSHFWTATLSGNGAREVQSYSPVFAYTSLKAHLGATSA